MVLCCRPPPETENSMGFDKYYVHILSNTHWDREWYMPHEKYLVRLVKLCDRLLDIMEKEPRYIFIADGQFSMIDDYLQVKPMNLQRIKSLSVRDGSRWGHGSHSRLKPLPREKP